MTMRNADARLLKLEARRQRADEFLAVWRKPGANVASALTDAKFASGDRIVCFEWFGNSPPPAPRWHRNLRADFTPEEDLFITRALREMIGSRTMPTPDRHVIAVMTDGELLHRIWTATPLKCFANQPFGGRDVSL